MVEIASDPKFGRLLMEQIKDFGKQMQDPALLEHIQERVGPFYSISLKAI